MVTTATLIVAERSTLGPCFVLRREKNVFGALQHSILCISCSIYGFWYITTGWTEESTQFVNPTDQWIHWPISKPKRRPTITIQPTNLSSNWPTNQSVDLSTNELINQIKPTVLNQPIIYHPINYQIEQNQNTNPYQPASLSVQTNQSTKPPKASTNKKIRSLSPSVWRNPSARNRPRVAEIKLQTGLVEIRVLGSKNEGLKPKKASEKLLTWSWTSAKNTRIGTNAKDKTTYGEPGQGEAS